MNFSHQEQTSSKDALSSDGTELLQYNGLRIIPILNEKYSKRVFFLLLFLFFLFLWKEGFNLFSRDQKTC